MTELTLPMYAIQEGPLVIVDGMDGTGKTTQLELANHAIQSYGFNIHTTRAHGGTPIGEALRSVSLSDIERPVLTDLHISLAIHNALAPDIAQHRAEGTVVTLDRGPASIAAYQIHADGMEDAALGWAYVDQEMELFKPSLMIIYTASVAIAGARARKASGAKGDYFENKGSDYFEKTSEGYLAAASRYGALVIDAEQSVNDVHVQTMRAIERVLPH